MNAPRSSREFHGDAPVPVHRPKRNSLRRHWLTGALVCAGFVLIGRTGIGLYQTEMRIAQLKADRSQVDAQIREARQRKNGLESELARVSSDAHREVMAKELGFSHENETVYQKGK